MSHKSGAIGELGYLAKYGKMKRGKVVANRVFPISVVRILYLGRAVTALHSKHVRNKMLRRCHHVDMTVKQSCSVADHGKM
jgi:hypothetical protein